MFTLIAAFSLASITSQDTTQSTAPAQPAASERKVCRNEESTSSRLGTRRVCRTAAEWEALNRGTQNDLRQRRD